MPHLFWAVDCKTEGCETQLFLKYIGAYEADHIPFLVEMEPDPIPVPCGECEQTYEYTRDEVVARISEVAPPDDFVDQF